MFQRAVYDEAMGQGYAIHWQMKPNRFVSICQSLESFNFFFTSRLSASGLSALSTAEVAEISLALQLDQSFPRCNRNAFKNF